MGWSRTSPPQPEGEEQDPSCVAAFFGEDCCQRRAGVGVLDPQHGKAEAFEVFGDRGDLDPVAQGLIARISRLDPVLFGLWHRELGEHPTCDLIVGVERVADLWRDQHDQPDRKAVEEPVGRLACPQAKPEGQGVKPPPHRPMQQPR